MSETGDTNIEYNIGTSNVNLPVRYNDTKIRNYIDKEINNVKLIINKAFSGSSFRFKFQNWKSANNIPAPGTIIFQNDKFYSDVNVNQAIQSNASIKNTEVKSIKISHFATGSNNIKNYLDKWNKDDILIAKGINKINNLGIFKIVTKRMDSVYMELEVEIIEPSAIENDFQIKSSGRFNEIAISFTSKAKIIEYIDTDNKSVFYSTKKLIVKDTDQNSTTTSNTTTNDYSNVALEVIGDINANGIQLTEAQNFNIKTKVGNNKITILDGSGSNGEFLRIDGDVEIYGNLVKRDSTGGVETLLFANSPPEVPIYKVSQFQDISGNNYPTTDNQLLAFDVASGKFKLSNQLIDLSNSVGNFTTIVNAIDSFNQINIEIQNNAINTVAGGFQTNKDNIQKNEDRILDLSAGRIKTNEDTIASHHTRITNVETNVLVDLSAGRIKTNEDTIASHGTRITNVETNVLVDLSAGRIKTNEDTIASHGTRITNVETNVLVDLSAGRIKTNEDTIASHGTRITNVETNVLVDLSAGRIKTNEDTIASHGTRITNVETNVLVDLSAGRIKTNENDIAQHYDWIINDLSGGRIKINENTINEHGIHLQIIDISNQKHEERLDDIDAEFTGLNANIGTNSNNISTLNTKINSFDITSINTTVASIADISANVGDLSKNVATNTNITKHIMLNGDSVGIGFDVSSNIGTGYALDISGTLNCTTLRIGGSIPKLTDTITISGEDYNLDFKLENNQYQHDLSSDLIISSTTNSNHAKVQILGVNESVLGMKTMNSGNEGKITWDGEKFKFDKPITCDDILIGGQPSDSFITWRNDKNRGNIFYDKGAVTFGPSGEILPSSHTKMLVKDGSLVVEEEKLNSTSDLNIVKHSSVINNNPFNINFKVKNNNNDASFNKILSDGYKFSTLLDNSLNDLLKVVDGSAVNCIIDVAEDANHNIYALAELTYDLSGYVYSDGDVKTTDNRSSLIKMYKINPTTNPNTISQSQVISHYLWSQNTAAVEDASLNALTKHNSNIYLDSINSRNMKLVVDGNDIYISAVLNYVKMNSENKKEFITYNNIFKYTGGTADITQCKTPDKMFVVQGPVNHGNLSERDKYTLGDLKNTTEIQFHDGKLYYSKYIDETLSIGALRASDLSNNQTCFHYTEDASSKMSCGSFTIDSNIIYFAADYYLYKVGTIDQQDANPITYTLSNQPVDGKLAGTGKLQTIVVDGALGESTISNVNGVTYKDGKVLVLEQTNVNYLRELSGNQLRTKQIFYEDDIALSSYNNTGYLSENHLRSISGELMLLDYTWSPIDIIYDTNQFTSDDYPSKQMYKPLGKIEDLTLTTDVSNIYHELTVANIEIRKDENSTVVTNGNNNVYYYPHDMVFSTSNKWDKPDGEKRMIIKSDGKIGIGLDQPGELLDISGNIRGKKLIVDDISGGVLTSDFVSQPGATKVYDASSLWQRLQGIDGSSNHLLGLINDLSGGRIKDSETDIVDISGRVAKTETDIADLSSGRIQTNENNIAVNADHITDISGRVHTNELGIASNLSLITDLSNGRIKTSEDHIAVNADHITDISGRVHTNEVGIASNLSLITDLSNGRIKTSEDHIALNAGHISDISGRVQINELAVLIHTEKIQTNKNNIATNTGDISDISGRVQNNRTDINSNANAIEDISKNKMTPLQTNFDDLKASVNNQIANINTQYDRNFNLFQNELNKTNISIEGASDSYGMDISNTNITDGHVLSWDKTGDKWLPKSVGDLQGNNTKLEDLNNVDLTGVTTKHIIKYNGTKWVSSDVPLPDAPTIVINNRKAGGIKMGHKSTTFLEMDDDGVLKVSPDLSTLLLQQFQTLDLKINQINSGVASVALSDGSITDLNDVDISYSNIQQGQALVWNSTENKWEPGVVASSGSDINATTDVSLNNLLLHGNITPDISNTRNIGSETKPFNEMYVKEIFVSNNSIWFGDSNKLSVAADGNLKIQKVNKNKIPKYINDLQVPSGYNTHLHAATARIYPNFNGIKQAKDFTLSHWIEYVNYYYPNTAAAADINFNTLVEGDELEEDTGVIENLVNADLSIHKIDISGDCNVGGVMDASNIQLEGVDISNIFAPIRNPVFTATNNVVFDCSVNIAKTLTVQNIVTTGQYSQLDVQNLEITNSLIGLNDGLTTTNPNDTGIIIERGTTGDNAFIGFKEDTDRFIMGTTTATTSDSGSLTVVPGTLIADLSGTAEIAKVANSLSGLTATASELNILDGCTVTTSQLNNLDNSFNILTATKQSLITSNTSLVAKDISANEGKFATLKTVVNGVASDVGSKLNILENTLTTLSATVGTTGGIGNNLIAIAHQANASATESKTRLDAHDTRLNNHDTSLNAIDTSLNVIDTRLNNHDTSLNTIDTSLNVIDGRLETHDTSLNTIDANLNVINTQLGQHDTSLNSIDTSLNDIDSRLNNHDTSLNTISAKLGNHDASLNTIDISLNVIDSRLVAHDASLNTIDISLNVIDNRLDNHDTSLNNIDSSLNVIDSRLNNHDTSLNTIDISLNVIDSRLDNHDTSLNNIGATLNVIDSRLNNHGTSLNNIGATLNVIDSRLNNHDTSLNNIDSSLNVMDSRLGNHDTSLNSIDASLNVMDSRLGNHDTSLNSIDASLNVMDSRLGQHDNSFNDIYTKLENVNINNSSITDLSDVSITAPSDGQVLVWNDASGVWKPGESGTTIDSTTDISVNNLEVSGNLVVKYIATETITTYHYEDHELSGWDNHGGGPFISTNDGPYSSGLTFNTTSLYLNSDHAPDSMRTDGLYPNVSFNLKDINGNSGSINNVKMFFWRGISSGSVKLGDANQAPPDATTDQQNHTGYNYYFELRDPWFTPSSIKFPKHFVIAGTTEYLSNTYEETSNSGPSQSHINAMNAANWQTICEYKYTGSSYNEIHDPEGPNTDLSYCELNVPPSRVMDMSAAGINFYDINGRNTRVNDNHNKYYVILKTTAPNLPLYKGFCVFVKQSTSNIVALKSFNIRVERLISSSVSVNPTLKNAMNITDTTCDFDIPLNVKHIDAQSLTINGQSLSVARSDYTIEKQGVKELTVTVGTKTQLNTYPQGSSNAYFIDGEEAPYLKFTPGKTYKFDQSDASNNGHPILFYLDAGKIKEYTTGVTTVGTAGANGAYVEIEITDSTPTKLYYQCGAHPYMGNSILIEGYANLASLSIADLSNVSTTAPTDGQALVWNDASGVWQPGNSGTDITESFITDLSDVDISYSTITNGAHLIWNDIGKKWQAFNPTTTVIERSSAETRVSHTALDIVATKSASTNASEIYSSLFLEHLFSGTGTIFHSENVFADTGNTYSGGVSPTNEYNGLWIQQEYESPIYFTKFKLYARGTVLNMSPKELRVFVGNDETNWTVLYEFTKTSYIADEVVVVNFTGTVADTPYTFIRFVFHTTFGSQYLSFRELEIFGNKTETTTVTNISITNPSDVDVSGNLKVGGDISFNGNLYQNGTLFTGGTTIDSTTDISVNHLDVSSNLKVDGRLTIGKDILSGQNATQSDGNEYDITFLSYQNYKNWVLFNTSNNNGGWIPQGSDFTIEYEHKITKGSDANYVHFAVFFEGTELTASDFGNTSYFMYYSTNWDAAVTFRYWGGRDGATAKYKDTETVSSPLVTLNYLTQNYVNVKYVYIASTDKVNLYFNGALAECIIWSDAFATKPYGKWGFGEWNKNTHHIRNPRITISNSTHTLTSVHSRSNTHPPTTDATSTGDSFSYSPPALDVSGNGFFTGNIFSNSNVLSSDDRLKHNETIPTTPLNTIMKMTPKHYFKTRTMYDASHNFTVDAQGNPMNANGMLLLENNDYTKETGIIAQDLQSIPELNYTVKNNGANEPLGVDYNSIHCLHIAATKELNEKLNAKVIKLEEENAVLRNELSEIKDYLGL